MFALATSLLCIVAIVEINFDRQQVLLSDVHNLTHAQDKTTKSLSSQALIDVDSCGCFA